MEFFIYFRPTLNSKRLCSLVAIPSHMIVRRRDECCAPAVTAVGIAAGLIIMLLAFGPSLYFLFKKRFERMKPRSKRKLEKSE